MQVRSFFSLPLAAAAMFLASAMPAFPQTPGEPEVVTSNDLSLGVGSPPVSDNGGPYDVECTGQITAVAVDGSGSNDPDGTPLSAVLWFEECAFGFFEDPTSLQTNFVIDLAGECTRTCVYVLRVTSGGETTVSGSTATVSDTTAPTISFCPADVTDTWGIDTSPANTGTATAVDVCDPSPTVSFNDVITPQQGPGIEQIITRTWTATDNCLFTATCTQVITLLSPSAGGGSLELDTGSCENHFPLLASDPKFRPLMLGTARVLINRVDLGSLRLSRPGHDGFVSPILPATITFPDVARSVARRLGECNPSGKDGYKDFPLSFNRPQVISALGLDTVAPGTRVPILLTGRLKTGATFWSMDVMTID